MLHLQGRIVPSRRALVNAKENRTAETPAAELRWRMAMSHVLAGEIPVSVAASRRLSIKACGVGNKTIDA
jgi:hypothetical protein